MQFYSILFDSSFLPSVKRDFSPWTVEMAASSPARRASTAGALDRSTDDAGSLDASRVGNALGTFDFSAIEEMDPSIGVWGQLCLAVCVPDARNTHGVFVCGCSGARSGRAQDRV